MSAATNGPWWTTAANPTCRPWCRRTHEVDEFALGGVLACARVIGSGERFSVEVIQTVSEDGRGGLEYDSPGINEWALGESTEWSLEDLAEYGHALVSAVHFARWVATHPGAGR